MQLKYLLKYIDYILVMSVEPGFGGQTFEMGVLEKIEDVKKLLHEMDMDIPIAVDGGINEENAQYLKQLGVDIIIVGSALFAQKDLAKAVEKLKAAPPLFTNTKAKSGGQYTELKIVTED